MVLELRVAITQKLILAIAKLDAVEHDTMDIAKKRLRHFTEVVALVIRIGDEVETNEVVEVLCVLSDDSVGLIFLARAEFDQCRGDTDSILSDKVAMDLMHGLLELFFVLSNCS